jgi:chemotaxis protein histidine kinase CheA
MIHRLEEITRKSVQVVGDRRVVVYRDQVMPLIDLTEVLGISMRDSQTKSESDLISVFVSMINDRYVGFIIKSIKDVCAVLDNMDTAIRDREMIAGSIEANGKVISMIDIYAVLEAQGILKSMDAGANLKKFAHGPEMDAANFSSINGAAELAKNDKTEAESTAFAGDGWGLF